MEKHSEQTDESRASQSSKRKYEPPEILSQEVFETTALACGKISGQGGGCLHNPKTS